MNQNYWDNNKQPNSNWQKQFNQQAQASEQVDGLQQFMTQTFTWMALGLALTGFVAAMTVSSQTLLSIIFGNRIVFYMLILAEFALVFSFSMAMRKRVATPVLITMFLTYSAMNGLTLSVVLLVYAMQTVGTAFFITSGMFGGLALYGYVTKKDLTGIGRIAGMAVWGLILAMIVNFFMGNSLLATGISVVGVLVFSALTAYDVQKLKSYYVSSMYDQPSLKAGAIGGALVLYLDFINLFLMILRLLGGNRK